MTDDNLRINVTKNGFLSINPNQLNKSLIKEFNDKIIEIEEIIRLKKNNKKEKSAIKKLYIQLDTTISNKKMI